MSVVCSKPILLKIQLKAPNSVGPTHTYKCEQVILSKEQCYETDICNFNEMSPQNTLKSDMVFYLKITEIQNTCLNTQNIDILIDMYHQFL